MQLADFYKAYKKLTPEQRNKVAVGKKNPITYREIYLICRENERVALTAVERIETILTLANKEDLQIK